MNRIRDSFARFSQSTTPLLVVGVLLLSVATKTHQLATSPWSSDFVLNSRLLTILLVEFQLFLALWLASKTHTVWARRVALCTFATFTIFLIGKVASGAESCGCFGELSVDPRLMLVLDLIVIVMLVFWKPDVKSYTKSELVFSLTVVMISMGVLLLPISSFEASVVADDGSISGNSRTVLLQPQDWIDKPMPVTRHIQFGQRLTEGEWLLVFYHEDCPKCQKIIDHYMQYGAKLQLAFVQVPPYERSTKISSNEIFWTWLDNKYKWFVETPTVVELKDGVVNKVNVSDPRNQIGG